ncbi:hypothetical protein MHTCC0001_19410 [Flavobacteriaceae bacterium MHTCC 0001]
MKHIFKKIIKPMVFKNWGINLGLAIPRCLAGLSLSFEFGAPKFGLPWSITEELGLFQVANWFPDDVSQFGLPFNLAPTCMVRCCK